MMPKVCIYCGNFEGVSHTIHCPADPVIQRALVEKFGQMAAIGNPYKELNETETINIPVQRPWGTYTILGQNVTSLPFWKIKKIVVNPNEALSLQSHQFRDETWTIVSGRGTFFDGFNFKNIGYPDLEVIHIKQETKHRLITGSTGIELIELALSYIKPIDENDITRYEDKYNRV